jgi:hypothetical protein
VYDVILISNIITFGEAKKLWHDLQWVLLRGSREFCILRKRKFSDDDDHPDIAPRSPKVVILR